jgi:transposase
MFEEKFKKQVIKQFNLCKKKSLITKQFGLTIYQLNQILEEFGIKKKVGRGNLIRFDSDKFTAMIIDGLSVKEAAFNCGIKINTGYQFLRRRGLNSQKETNKK